ncbi:hypothetical protein BRPE64_ACDS05130 [Caballeronia insecticola]|uniref:Uncharacterized protein n=1 Tax=Caballeronia insecticola TaxID=758793 RepID=R4WWL2_9BURK|nr:hypothetical protein BRPE64_ACDS05130 [Caballeronia insecticola]
MTEDEKRARRRTSAHVSAHELAGALEAADCRDAWRRAAGGSGKVLAFRNDG